MDKLKEIIKKIFQAKDDDINDMMSPQTIPNWDSLNYLMFIAETEAAFNVKFTMDEVMNARNLGDIKKYLRNKGVSL